jgi:plastocyanin
MTTLKNYYFHKPMDKKYSIAIAGLMVAGLSFLVAGCGSNQSAKNTNQLSNTNSTVTNSTSHTTGSFTTAPTTTVQINITGSGVDQPNLNVALGTRVEFRNADTADHRIAANPYPSHSDLPGLDRTISPGASYTFTFATAGLFGYHDHLAPNDTRFQGIINVSE